MKVGGSGPLNPLEAARKAKEAERMATQAAQKARYIASGEDPASSPAKPCPYQPDVIPSAPGSQHSVTHERGTVPPKPQASSGPAGEFNQCNMDTAPSKPQPSSGNTVRGILKANKSKNSNPLNTSDLDELTQRNTSQNVNP